VLNRISDPSTSSVGREQWLYRLSAVHYALSGSFAARDNWLANLIRLHPLLSKSMTGSAMALELLAPLFCLVGGRRRHWGALILIKLHLGLLATLNIPNWQLMGMIANVIWIPPHVWDRYCKWDALTHSDQFSDPAADHKKTDGDAAVADGSAQSASATSEDTFPKMSLRRTGSKLVQVFFFGYMIYNWLGNRGIAPKHDNGDIGEGLRLSQYWVMFGTVQQESKTIQLTGKMRSKAGDSNNATDAGTELTRVDLLHYISSGRDRIQEAPNHVPTDMTSRYPSPRWERVLSRFAELTRHRREQVMRMCAVLCTLLNEDRPNRGLPELTHVEFLVQTVKILPPGSSERYADKDLPRIDAIEADCSDKMY